LWVKLSLQGGVSLEGKNTTVEYICLMYMSNQPVAESQLEFANHLEGIKQHINNDSGRVCSFTGLYVLPPLFCPYRQYRKKTA
jgi:hypothetical protein